MSGEPPFDLAAYARKHRYRLRNLHDGGPVPPARRPAGHDGSVGYVGARDRWDVIVGYDGYVAMDGNGLSVFVSYRSGRGVKRAVGLLLAIGGQIEQIGDTEVGATVPVDCIEDVLKLIRVSKLRSGDATRFRPHTEAVLVTESHE